MDPARDKAVVDEDVLFDRQRRVQPFEVAGAIAPDAMSQGEILCPGGGANRIRLHETEPVDRARQAERLEQAAGNRKAAKLVESHTGYCPPSPAWWVDLARLRRVSIGQGGK